MSQWRRGLIALVVVVSPGLFVHAQDGPVELKWKFEKDKPFYQEMTTDTKQTMKVMGMDIVQVQKQTFFFSWTPEKMDEKEKSWVIRQKIEGVKMNIEIGGNKIEYDSLRDLTTGNPLSEFFKAIVGAEFKITVGPDMKVLKVDGREEFLKKLTTANQQMEPLLKTILNDEALKQMADPSFSVVPPKPVKKGDTWIRDTKLAMGPIGTYENHYKYTFDGPDATNKNLMRIKVDTTLKYIPPPDTTAAGSLPFKIKSAKLEGSDAAAFVLFDVAKGRVDSSEMKMTIKGELNIEIGNQTTKVELTQEQKTTLKTTDTNPVKR